MIKPYLTLGPVKLHYYGLIISAAVYIGLRIAQNRSKFYRIPSNLFEDPIVLIPLILALVGGRIYHVIDKWVLYSSNPVSVLYVSNGGLGIWGALIGIFAGVYFICRIKKFSYLTLMDIISPSLLFAQAIGRIGNFYNQEGFGPPTQKPWGVFISVENRPVQYMQSSHFHPTFFYEMILDLIFFALLLKITKNPKKQGQIFGFYLILYSLGRFLVEIFRIDTWVIGEIKVAQILAIMAICIGIFLVLRAQRKVG